MIENFIQGVEIINNAVCLPLDPFPGVYGASRGWRGESRKREKRTNMNSVKNIILLRMMDTTGLGFETNLRSRGVIRYQDWNSLKIQKVKYPSYSNLA